MRKFRRSIALCLLLTLLVGIVPVHSLAADTDTQATLTREPTAFVNPVYASAISEKDLTPVENIPMEAAATVYTSKSTAAAALREALKNHKEEISFTYRTYSAADTIDTELLEMAYAHTGQPGYGDNILYQLAGGYSGYERIYSNGTYTYNIVYTITYMTTLAQEAKVDTAVDNLLASLNLSGKTDLEKILAIYTWICNNVTYDYSGLSDPSDMLEYTAYDAIINRSAVCQGYANLLYRLLLEVGIDCRIIDGTADGGAHAWNIVKLGSKYYNLDATWDANTFYDYFLRGSTSFNADHTPNSEYTTSSFKSSYPISTTDYAAIVKTGKCGENVTWSLDNCGHLIISGSGAMYDYTSYKDTPWYSVWYYIDEIVVTDGVTHIGDRAFQILWMTEVNLGDTVKTIGEYAFGSCDYLHTVILPASLQEVGYAAFYDSPAITTVKYGGTQTQWKAIDMTNHNDNLTGASIQYGYVNEGLADGWFKEGTHWVYYDTGIMLREQWLKDGSWYYLDADGYMVTGWEKISGEWYYFAANGVMTTGWQKIAGKWYYLGADGAMTTGWQKVAGKWYYMNTSGVMQTGWVQLSGKWYYLNSYMVTGWQKIGGNWYYMNASGVMQTGWVQLSGKWYYLNASGVMQTGWVLVAGKWYYMNASGVMQTGWQYIDGNWYYLKNNMKTGWVQLSGKWYYLGTNGAMVTGTRVIDGVTYTFNSSGVWIA